MVDSLRIYDNLGLKNKQMRGGISGLDSGTVLKKWQHAVISGFATKLLGLLVQLFTLPVLARSLGEQRLAIFLLISGIPSVVFLCQIGAGPGLTHRVASSLEKSDWGTIRKDFFAAIFISVFLSIFLLVLFSVSISFGIIEILFQVPTKYASESRLAAFILVCLAVASVIASPCVRAQAGIHEVRINNFAGSLANIVGVLLVIYAASAPSISIAFASVVSFSTTTIGSYLSAVLFVFTQRRNLFHKTHVPITSLKSALSDGASFTLFELLQTIQRELAKVVALYIGGPSSVVQIGTLMQLILVQRSVVFLVSIPGSSYVTHLFISGKNELCRKVQLGIDFCLIPMAVLLGAVGYFIGIDAYDLLYHRSDISSTTFALAGVCAAATNYKSVLMLFSTAIGMPWLATKAAILELPTFLITATVLVYLDLDVVSSLLLALSVSTAIPNILLVSKLCRRRIATQSDNSRNIAAYSV